MKCTLKVICTTLSLLGAAAPPMAAAIPLKAVWYMPSRGTLLRELMDDAVRTPPGISPRRAAVISMDQTFYKIKSDLHANAIIIKVSDRDAWQGRHYGGLTYNPIERPDTGVWQELILSIADKHGLEVIFDIQPSEYHLNVSDTYGSYVYQPGAYNFIQQCFDPRVYYGSEMTTQLDAAGLTDHWTRSYYDDPRVAGWLLGGGWDLLHDGYIQGSAQKRKDFLVKYWGFFRSLVKWAPEHGGGYAGFAGTYTAGSPDSSNPAVPGSSTPALEHIDSMKQLFQENVVLMGLPEVLGINWYGNTPFQLDLIRSRLADMIWYTMTDRFPLEAGAIMLMEGGTDQSAQPGGSQYYVDSIHEAVSWGVGGVWVWSSDSYANHGWMNCANEANPTQAAWALFTHVLPGSQGAPPVGCAVYPDIPAGQPGWHDWVDHDENPSTPPILEEFRFVLDLAYGVTSFTGLTAKGQAVAAEFSQH